MPSYELLDSAADSVNPMLGVAALVLTLLPIRQRNWNTVRRRLGALIAVLAVVYALKFLDRLIDPANAAVVGYSTHSAFAIAVGAFCAACVPRAGWFCLVIVAMYLLLIVYQGYHPLADVVLAGVLVGPAAWYLLRIAGVRSARVASVEPIENG